jgi:hypothetical protein
LRLDKGPDFYVPILGAEKYPKPWKNSHYQSSMDYPVTNSSSFGLLEALLVNLGPSPATKN